MPTENAKPRRHKPRVTGETPAGPDHQVLHVEGGGGHQRSPCAECPWRKDSPIGAFPAEAYRISAPTAYDRSEQLFACHMLGRRAMTCAGFLLRGADHNMRVRFQDAMDQIGEVSDGGLDLYDSYRAMAEANGVSPDDPVLAPCR